MKSLISSFVALGLANLLVNGLDWNLGLDGELHADSPRPTFDTLVSNAYPYLSKGTLPIRPGLPGEAKAIRNITRNSSGRLNSRQLSCGGDSIASCPPVPSKPDVTYCCYKTAPVCCIDTMICCASGQYCSTKGCCDIGTSACGDGCCSSSETCCDNSKCCAAGYVCTSGQCVNPVLSIQSVQSIQSIAAAASASSASVAASLSAASASSVAAASASFASAEASRSAAIASSAAAASASAASVAASLSSAAASSLSAASAAAETSRSLQSASMQSVASVSSQSAASVSSASVASVSAQLAGQSSTVSTANVSPTDSRIQYNPPNSWVDTTSSSGIGLCTNGTKVTNHTATSLSFVFRGTAIALSIIPSSNGGSFTVQIDGDNVNSLSSKAPAGQAGDQCVASTIYSRDNLADQPHKIVIANGDAATGSGGATLEFNGFTYTGLGAVGTDTSPASSGPSSTVIGASVGGAIGALLLLGAGGFLFIRTRQKRDEAGAPDMIATSPGPPSATEPILYQHQPGGIHTRVQASTGSPPSYLGPYDGVQEQVTAGMAGVGLRNSGTNYPYLPQAQTPDPYKALRTGMPQGGGQSFYTRNLTAAHYQRPIQPLYNSSYIQEHGRSLSESSSGSGPMTALPMWIERSNSGSTPSPCLMPSADYSHPGLIQPTAIYAATPEDTYTA